MGRGGGWGVGVEFQKEGGSNLNIRHCMRKEENPLD